MARYLVGNAVSSLPPLPPKKVFQPKFALPVLVDYRSPASEEYWEHFHTNLISPARSLIRGDVLERLALEAGGVDPVTLQKACEDLVSGAKLGCRGDARLPIKATNAPNAFEDGEKVSDTICDWIQKGFAYGPVDLCDSGTPRCRAL